MSRVPAAALLGPGSCEMYSPTTPHRLPPSPSSPLLLPLPNMRHQSGPAALSRSLTRSLEKGDPGATLLPPPPPPPPSSPPPAHNYNFKTICRRFLRGRLQSQLPSPSPAKGATNWGAEGSRRGGGGCVDVSSPISYQKKRKEKIVII